MVISFANCYHTGYPSATRPSRMIPSLMEGRNVMRPSELASPLSSNLNARTPEYEENRKAMLEKLEEIDGLLDEAEAAYYAVVDRHPNRSIVELKLRNLSNRRTRRDREPTVVIQRGRALKSRR